MVGPFGFRWLGAGFWRSRTRPAAPPDGIVHESGGEWVMNSAEVAVLAALHPDHTLTAAQIRQVSTLTSWRTRNALAQLEFRGLILRSQPRGRWRISPRGRVALMTKGKRFA